MIFAVTLEVWELVGIFLIGLLGAGLGLFAMFVLMLLGIEPKAETLVRTIRSRRRKSIYIYRGSNLVCHLPYSRRRMKLILGRLRNDCGLRVIVARFKK